MPHDSDALLVNCLTDGGPERMPNSPSKQHEPFDCGLTQSTSTDPKNEGLHADNDTPVPLSQSSRIYEEPTPMEILEFYITA